MKPHRQIIVAFRAVADAMERRVARLKLRERVQVVCLPWGSEDYVFKNLKLAYECYEIVAQYLDVLPARELCGTEVLIGSVLRLPESCGTTKRNDHVGLLDHGWDPLRNYGTGRDRRLQPSLETVAAWWILTYPEVKWLWWTPILSNCGLSRGEESMRLSWVNQLSEWHCSPVGVSEPLDNTAQDLTGLHELVRHFPTLFDPSGLRASIRSTMGIASGSLQRNFQVCRTQVALAIDEEREYAQLEGYAAYRSGYRAWVASTWGSFKHLWAWRGTSVPELRASFEDLYLAFADQVEVLPQKAGFDGEDQHLSNLIYRDAPHKVPLRNLLAESPHRVLVTVGHKRGKNGWRTWSRNLSHLKSRACSYRIIRKPLGSVHLLLNKAGLRADSGWIAFVRDLQRQEDARHSAPGRILLCAERLLQRSRRILKECDTPEAALHAAVLALEAKELLSGQTPTTTLDAIALQHEAEVTAESLFLGMEYTKDLRARFDELREEVDAVSYWFGSRHRKRSSLNARLAIAERLAKRFGDLNQIEEELKCLAEARKLRFAFWMREKPWRWLLWPLLRYLSFSLQSIPRFVGAVIAWGLLFGISYYIFGMLAGHPGLRFWDAVVSSWKFSFTTESVGHWEYLRGESSHSGWESFWKLWLAFQGAVSLTNFGLFFSHLYLVVSRR